MSKKEGEILKKAISDAGITQDVFAKRLGYRQSSGLKYWFDKERVEQSIKEDAAQILGKTVDEIFKDDMDKHFDQKDKEINLSADLIEAQKEVISLQKDKMVNANVTIINKVLNNEAYLQVVLRRIADLTHLVTKGTCSGCFSFLKTERIYLLSRLIFFLSVNPRPNILLIHPLVQVTAGKLFLIWILRNNLLYLLGVCRS